jgi:hypothetical protein
MHPRGAASECREVVVGFGDRDPDFMDLGDTSHNAPVDKRGALPVFPFT